jgi:CHAT domain-containing protein/Tfp pilus assembly protein PilF
VVRLEGGGLLCPVLCRVFARRRAPALLFAQRGEQLKNRLQNLCNLFVAHMLCWCVTCLPMCGQTNIPEPASILNKGLVVESLVDHFEGEKAGIKPGDVLVKWSRNGKGGEFDSPFDLLFTRLEQASRGTVEVEGLRGSEKRIWRLGSDYWGIEVRPNFSEALSLTYQEVRDLAQAGRLPDAIERWKASGFGASFHLPWLHPWFLSHLAEVSADHQSWQGYDDAYQEALREGSAAGPVAKAELFKQWAGGLRDRGDLQSAEKYYQAAVSEYRTTGGRTMAVSSALKDLGGLAFLQGNYISAEESFRESLEIAEELAPSGIQVVWDLISLGFLSQERGDFARAEDYYRKSLALEQANFPAGRDISLTLRNLGELAHRRGDLAKAEAYYRRALAIAGNLGPDSQYNPDVLSNLAECVLDRGDPETAEEYEQRALSIREKEAPGSLAVGFSLSNLGKIARVRGDLVKAEEYYRRALAVGEGISPTPHAITEFLVGLGDVARQGRQFAKAENYYRRALAILDKVAPDGLDHGVTLAALAGSLRDQDRLDLAAGLYKKALAELDNKTTRLGGVEEDRSRYRAQHERYRREYIDLLVAQGQPDHALEVLEGSRARTLLEVLSRATIDIRRNINPALLEREHSLQQLRNSKSAYRLRLLSGKHTEQQVTSVDKEIKDLLDQYQETEADVLAMSPAYAALTQPQPLGTKEIQQLLDDDTLLLEYCLGESRSYVWAVSEKRLTLYQLPKRSDIEAAARRVYELLAAQSLGMGGKGHTEAQLETHQARMEREYPKAAMELSRMVLGPVAALLKGKRLLIVSDGALQYIPFSALPVPAVNGPAEPQPLGPKTAARERASTLRAIKQIPLPLIVEHEIVNLPSASILAELRRQAKGRPVPPKTVAVLADPVFTSTDERVDADRLRSNQRGTESAQLLASAKPSLSADHLTRSVGDVAVVRGERFSLERLLYTRREAEAIMSVTPGSKKMKALDFQANRETATSAELAQYRIVHFATHGLLNNEHPELSGLVLSLVNNQGKPQNGFLELEDIYNLHLPVDLVVLSACDTALGQDMKGEGLVGLTRGFMYAGATRVMASLWSVNDAATSELMARFYKEMLRGTLRPAAALRTAQIQMWKQRQWTSPYYWAPFQIQGDWR